jgi:hypothetical protein
MDFSKFEIIGSITAVEAIAIYRQIRELRNLRKLFGRGRWKKMKGQAVARFSNGLSYRVEVHWYEAHGIGKRKMKIKRLIQQLP